MDRGNGSPRSPFEAGLPAPLNGFGASLPGGTSSLPSVPRHSSPTQWRNKNAAALVSTVVEDGVAPGRIGDMLDAGRYHGRVLDPDSEEAKRTNQHAAHYIPGLMGRKKRHGRRPDEEEEEEDDMHRDGLQRVVVDGVEDLQHATTGLLTRHLGEELNVAPSTLAQQSVHYLATEPRYYAMGTRHLSGGSAGSSPLSSPTKPSPAPPVDDRVTPQALHMLLRKGQQRAAHTLAQGRLNGRYYTFAAGPGAKEAAAAALERAEAQSTIRPSGGASPRPAVAVLPPSAKGGDRRKTGASKAAALPGVKSAGGTTARSKHTVKGATPADFLRATSSSDGAAVNPLLASTAVTMMNATQQQQQQEQEQLREQDAEQLAFLRAQLAKSGITNMDNRGNAGQRVLSANISYLEPPSIAAAHQALYRTRLSATNANGGESNVEPYTTRTGPDRHSLETSVAAMNEVHTPLVTSPTRSKPQPAQRTYVPYAAPELASTAPVSLATAAMTYPPPPVVYGSAEDAKKARDRHRLRPMKLRSKEEMRQVQDTAGQGAPTGILSRGVRDALLSTTGGIGGAYTTAAGATHSDNDAYDDDGRAVDSDVEDMNPYNEKAKKYGVEMDVPGVKDGLALDFAFSAALRGDDRQLVEQLTQQYGEQCLRRQLEARRQTEQRRLRALKRTGQFPPALGTLTEKNVLARRANQTQGTVTSAFEPGDDDENALAVEEPPFSVLEMVLAVSREFEKIKPTLLADMVDKQATTGAAGGDAGQSSSGRFLAGAAVPLESSVLARDRRSVVDRLIGFGTSRIPGRFWVTLQERGAAAAGRQAGAASNSSGALAGTMNATMASATRAESSLGGYARSKVPIMSQFASSTVGSGAQSATTAASALSVSHQPKDGSMLTLLHQDEADGRGERGEPSAANVLFPATRPTGRAQVYLLAETLDHMLLHDSTLLKTVTDPGIAYRILPRVMEEDVEVGETVTGEEEAVTAEWLLTHTREAQHPLLSLPTRKAAEESFREYTNAAAEVLAVVDAGLVEVVRQVASQCVERGALLDALRQTIVDLTDSSLHVLAYAKERACEEAVHSLGLRRELEGEHRLCRALERSQAQADAEVVRLRAENEHLGEKAAHLDLLVARAEAKRNRFDLEADDDDHAGLLKALEEEINDSAMRAMNDLYEAEAALGTGGTLRPTRGEAPSAAEARRRLTEQKAAKDQLYSESYALLRTMHEATSAMNDATAPLYKAVALDKVSLNANVAARRWAEVARAVGVFEADKAHRYHVFQVFSDWCDRYQSVHHMDEDGMAARGSTGFLLSDDADDTEPATHALRSQTRDSANRALRTAEALMSSSSVLMDVEERHGGGVDGDEDGDGDASAASRAERGSLRHSLRQSTQSARLSLQGRRHHIQDLVRAKIRKQQQQQDTQQQPQRGGEEEEADGTQEEALHQVLQSIQYVTADDLVAMGVDDCSVDEINAMFARDFDFRDYLYTQWEPQGTTFTLDLADVVDMLHDVSTTIQEMTLRMKAIATSAIVRRGVEPPMQPPSRPGDACALCGRRDGAAEEKRRRQETMRVIARQVQVRLDQMKEKCQHAEADREVARNESRRLEGELNATLQREQHVRKQLRELTEQMGSGAGKVIPTGRRGSRSGAAPSSKSNALSTPSSRARTQPRTTRSGSGSGGDSGSTTPLQPGSHRSPTRSGVRRTSVSSGAIAPSSILTPHQSAGRRANQPRDRSTPPILPVAPAPAASVTPSPSQGPPSEGSPTSSTGSTGVLWENAVHRSPNRRQSAVVGVFAPHETAQLSPLIAGGGGGGGGGGGDGAGNNNNIAMPDRVNAPGESGDSSPTRRRTLPPSVSGGPTSSEYEDDEEDDRASPP